MEEEIENLKKQIEILEETIIEKDETIKNYIDILSEIDDLAYSIRKLTD